MITLNVTGKYFKTTLININVFFFNHTAPGESDPPQRNVHQSEKTT